MKKIVPLPRKVKEEEAEIRETKVCNRKQENLFDNFQEVNPEVQEKNLIAAPAWFSGKSFGG